MREKKSHETYIQELAAIHGTGIICLGQYAGNNVKIEFQCGVCNYVWLNMPKTFISARQTGCPKCAWEMKALSDQQLYDRLLSKSERDNNGCLICGIASRFGYPTLGRRGKMMRASKFIYEYGTGQRIEEHHILHSCDNPPCINLAHLYLGDHSQNMIDTVTRKRHSGCHPGGRRLLLFSEVLEIRRTFVLGLGTIEKRLESLAKQFNVNRATIYNIVTGKTWKTPDSGRSLLDPALPSPSDIYKEIP